MNKLINIICLGLCLVIANTYAVAADSQPVKKVLISQVIDHPALNATTQGIIDSLDKAGFKQGINIEIRVESAQANSVVAAQIANKFVAQHPDVVVGVGTLSAQSFIKPAASNKVNLVFSSVTDPIAAHLIGANITGVSNFVPLEPQLQMIRKFQPGLKRLGIIYSPGEINSVSLIERLSAACAALDITLVKQPAAKTADVVQATAKIVSNVDAVFISNDNIALSSLQSIIKITQSHKHMVPVYVSDTDAVKLGAIAALGPNQRDLGMQTGRMIAKILNGAAIKDLPVEYPSKLELAINLEEARKIGVRVPTNVLDQADIVIGK